VPVYSDTVPQNHVHECLPSCIVQPNVIERQADRRYQNVSFHAIEASQKEKVIMLQAGISPI
jgi:hypothetical protein